MTDAPTPRDVLAEAAWRVDCEIAGAPEPRPTWEQFRELDPETAAIYVTQAGCYISALTAAGYVIEHGWRDIASAPRDGTRVLCYAPAAEGRASLVRNDYWWVQERGFAHMRPDHPYTHWRPLPAAPTTKEDAP